MDKPIDPHCAKDALTGVFGWLLQFILAALAFTCLILKRFCEPRYKRRPWLIWFYDTSKQGLGAFVMHVANILLSGQFFQGDPCTCLFRSTYIEKGWLIELQPSLSIISVTFIKLIFLGFEIAAFVSRCFWLKYSTDSSIGLFIIYIGIRYCQCLAEKNNWAAINFGEYGKPPSAQIWLIQCGLYVLLMLVMKVIITLLMQFSFWEQVRDFILSPIPNAYLELAIVMLIIPLFVNALMFWVTDDFLMKRSLEARRKRTLLQAVKVQYHKLTRHDDNEDDGILSADDELLGAGSSVNTSPVHVVNI